MTDQYIDIGDKVLKLLSANNGTYFSSDVFDDINPKYDPDLHQHYFYAITQMQDHQLVEYYGGGGDSFIRLLPGGFKAAKSGIKKYLDEQESREIIRVRKDENELAELEFHLKIKWWPFIISGLSLVASIVLPILLSR